MTILLAAAFAAQARAEEIKAMGSLADKMVLSVYRVPPGFIPRPEKSPEAFRSKENPRATHYDAKEYFEKSGVPFPPGATVIYKAESSKLLVLNTQDNLDLLETIVGDGCKIGYCYGFLSCELQAFECDLGSLPRYSVGSTPTYADLKHLPPSAIKLIDQISSVLKSGNKIETGSYLSAPPSGGQAPTAAEIREQLKTQQRFADEEFGTLATIETVLGPDDVTCNTTLSCRMKIPSDQGGSVEFQFRNDFVTLGDQPVAIYSAPLPGPGGKTLVVVAKIQRIDFDGLIFNPQAPGPESSR